jgi:fermentation-respiration switch protein FrsA (DUF1100 family)
VRGKPRRGWVMVVITLLVIVLLPVAALWLLQRKLIFLPDTTDPGPAAATVPGARDVVLHTGDGLDLTAWYLPPSHCSATVLVAPGNGGNRAGRVDLMSGLGARGAGVLLLEYRGFGGNPGKPTEAGLTLDAEAARAFLDAQLPADQDIVYLGESLGGAVVTRLAVQHPPAAMVLRSPFLDLPAAAAHLYPVLPVRLMLRDRFPVRDLVASVSVPITVVLGDADRTIPPEQSVAVAAAAPNGTVVRVPAADHNDPVLAAGPAVIDAVLGEACGP